MIPPREKSVFALAPNAEAQGLFAHPDGAPSNPRADNGLKRALFAVRNRLIHRRKGAIILLWEILVRTRRFGSNLR
jgi:hypothetical protein